jgi:hypothetical protein
VSGVIDLHAASKAVLEAHFTDCPYRCEPNHIKCLLGWDLVGIEERAWFAARKVTLSTNGPYGENREQDGS